jgi:type IV secretion system protein VirB6
MNNNDIKQIIIIVITSVFLSACAIKDIGCLFASTMDNALDSSKATSNSCNTSSSTSTTSVTYKTNVNSFVIRADGNYSNTSKKCSSWCTDPSTCDQMEYSSNDPTNCIPIPNSTKNSSNAGLYIDKTKFGQWKKTGISVNIEDQLNVMVRGEIHMCSSTGVNTKNSYASAANVPPGYKIPNGISSKDSSWQNLSYDLNPYFPNQVMVGNITVNKCDRLRVYVDEPSPSINDASLCTGNNPLNSCNRFTYDNRITTNWTATGPDDQGKYKYSPVSEINDSESGMSVSSWAIKGQGLKIRIGSDYYWATKKLENITNNTYTSNNVVPNDIVAKNAGALSIKIHDFDGNYGDNAGGYMPYMQHYSCVGVDGSLIGGGQAGSDFNKLGNVQIIVVDPDSKYNNPNDQVNGAAAVNAAAKITKINADDNPKDSLGCPLPYNDSGTIGPSGINPALMGKNQITSKGEIWVRVADTDDCGGGHNSCYADNSGEYKVTIQSVVAVPKFSSMTHGLINSVKNTLMVAAKNIFQNITCTGTGINNSVQNGSSGKCLEFLKIIGGLLTLYIIFYAISFTFGLIQINQTDLVIRIFKISIVIALTRADSWTFFSETFFKIYIDGTAHLISIMTGDECPVPNPFAFADKVLEFLLFDTTTIIRLTALIYTSNIGIIYFFLILFGVIIVIISILKALVVYLMSFVAIAMLIALAPIFLPMMLFSWTKGLFDNWLKYLFKYSIEPVILIVGLAILSNLLLISMNNIMGQAVCWKCAIPITLNIIPGVPLNLFCIPFFLPWGYDNSGGGALPLIIGKFTDIMFFLVVAQLMRKYEGLSNQISSILSETMASITSSTEAAKSFRTSISEALKSATGTDKESKDRRTVNNNSDEIKSETMARNKAKLPGTKK